MRLMIIITFYCRVVTHQKSFTMDEANFSVYVYRYSLVSRREVRGGVSWAVQPNFQEVYHMQTCEHKSGRLLLYVRAYIDNGD